MSCARCHMSYCGQDNWIKSEKTGRLLCDMCQLFLATIAQGRIGVING